VRYSKIDVNETNTAEKHPPNEVMLVRAAVQEISAAKLFIVML
jgi:hypothetical protein